MDVATLLEEQEAIVLQRMKDEELARSKRDSSDSQRIHRGDGHERERADDTKPRRRELDHYDGRRDGHRNSNDRYLSEREENDQRRSRRSKDLTDDADAKAGSDKDSANGSVRSRHRSRSPRTGTHRSDRRGYRARSHSRGSSPRRHHNGDSYPSSSGRLRGPDDHHRDDNREDRRDDHHRDDRDRRDERRSERSDDRRHASRRDDAHRSSGRRGDTYRTSRRSPDGRRRSPEPTDEERDRRTVFVQQLAARLKVKELRRFFEQVGPVIDAQIVTDRVSGRSKGVGYVEFKDDTSVDPAIALTGQKLLGIPIIVQLTEAEKNRQARDKETTTTRNNTLPQTRLYVGNIQFNITEEDLTNVFASWGEVVNVSLQKDEAGRSKGFAFIEFTNAASAKSALENMNNFKLGDRAIRVGLGGDRNSTFPDAERPANGNAKAANLQGSSFSGMGGRGAHAGGTGIYDRAGGRDTDKIGGASALDDHDMSDYTMTNYSRDTLMRNLSRQVPPSQVTAPKVERKKVVVEAPTATRCIVLKNVYTAAKETEPGWQKIITDDIAEECNKSFGKVVHVALATDLDDGEVYVKFKSIDSGKKAYQSLQGRYFGGHQITAQYVVDVVYNSLYPKASNV